MSVVLPVTRAGLSEEDRVRLRDLPRLLATHAPQLEQLLGAPQQVMTFDPGRGPRWLVGPSVLNPSIPGASEEPVLVLDRPGQLLITDAPDVEGLFQAVALLASASRLPDGRHPVAPCASVEEAVERVEVEVGETWASFERRGLDWRAVCARHRPRVIAAEDPVPALQAWLAELGDTHTWVSPAQALGQLPYQVWVQRGDAVLMSVPHDTVGWRAGARPGHRLVCDATGWWDRTAAPGYARPLIAGHRLLSGPVGSTRALEARGPGGRRVAWEERVPRWPWERPVQWRQLPSGAGYLRVHRFLAGEALPTLVDEALDALSGAQVLIVDLRGNGGGNPYAAARFRSRFLHQPTRLGSIRYRMPGGRLSSPFPIEGEPAARPRQRWDGPVRFLTDALTHSSAEDALLGLQGLPHVVVVGEPSGGGSRQVRELPLLPGYKLGVSTALTYDRYQRCVEGAGIPVDRLLRPRRLVPGAEDPVLAAAERT